MSERSILARLDKSPSQKIRGVPLTVKDVTGAHIWLYSVKIDGFVKRDVTPLRSAVSSNNFVEIICKSKGFHKTDIEKTPVFHHTESKRDN